MEGIGGRDDFAPTGIRVERRSKRGGVFHAISMTTFEAHDVVVEAFSTKIARIDAGRYSWAASIRRRLREGG